MKHRLMIGLGLLLALLAAAPALAQDTVLGVFEGQFGDGNNATGAITLRGWALASSGVRQVIVQVDGIDIGAALYGRERPEVDRTHPGFPDSKAAGFGYRLNTVRFSNGPHHVSIRVISNAGSDVILSGSRTYEFNNNTHILKPFGAINTPQRNTEVFGTCDPFDPRRRITEIEGWALDLGVETNDAGVGYVELMIDNQIVSNTRTGCFFEEALGGLTNCYGLPRPAIERLYPFARDAPNAGFRFVLDIGFLISSRGYTEGQHLFTIRSGDVSNQLADVDEISVVFRCIEGEDNEGTFGRIESPRPGRAYADIMPVQGWAIDWEGVDRVQIWIDGEFRRLAAFGARDGIFETRPEVFSEYVGYPDVEAPVWRLRGGFDTRDLSNGEHTVQVVIVDVEGVRTGLGEVTFFVDNEVP